VKVPDGLDSARVRTHLLERYSIEIGAGVGRYAESVWRIGLMGPNATPAGVTLVLGALEEAIAAS
jgi:alanine-glyoxylate transaminase/serine-glyoxylate transaminase/serine-pyruvate transaminase